MISTVKALVTKTGAALVSAKTAYAAADKAWIACTPADMLVVGDALREARKALTAADAAYAAARATAYATARATR